MDQCERDTTRFLKFKRNIKKWSFDKSRVLKRKPRIYGHALVKHR